ncbi:Carnitine O-acetyltransferase mitochondrial [Ascosphaera acerosa]|nr:Carnitine O-acetyltransferase mitochondrial [Ascosphaera acerosa]
MARKSSSVAEGYTENLSKGKMLRWEDSLPKLPVPSLEETGKRYLKSVHPLLSTQEFERTTAAVEAFVRPGGEGEQLQKRLLTKAQDPKVDNWIIDWWNNDAYLGYRDPVVPYVSYFYSYKDDRARSNPAKRAAAITTAALEIKREVDTNSIEPEYLRKEPMAMSSYKYMFNCCRIPAKPSDYPQKYAAEENQFIVAIRKNGFYKIPTHVNGVQLNTAELQRMFERVYETAGPQPAVGGLTSQNRDVWTDARAALLAASPANAASLRDIEAASFVVCLDDARPVTLEERAHQYWHGDGKNRWFDKPVQFIVNDNGTAGFMGEHSMMDGTPTQRINDYVNAMIFGNKLDFAAADVRADLPEPVALPFQVDEPVLQAIAAAEAHFAGQIGQHELCVAQLQAYGKGLIKRFKCSPDAYVQMLIQLAYHKMFGKNRPTYEAATTRRYRLGRTETIRSVSDDSVAWCAAMADPAVSREECVRLLRAALASHTKYTLDASHGYGVDRHLFGLKKLLQQGEPLPQIYQDPAYAYSTSWYLSTSQLSSEYFNGYGWSQVIDQGFGLAYMINENNLQINVVSKKLGSDRMSYYLNEAALDMRDLLMPDLAKEPEKAKL